MKRSIGLSLVMVLAISSVGSASAAPDNFATFWKKHGGKVIAGLVATGVVIVAGLGIAHGVKTKNVIDDTVDEDNPNRDLIIASVAIFGPIGQEKFFWAMNKAVEKGLIDSGEACSYLREVGPSLAKYWGKDSVISTLRGCGGSIYAKVKGAAKRGYGMAKEKMSSITQKVKNSLK